ncbi:hypothetical protein F4604DRAFT_1918063 [Suillus subluteus]|nr:hypothetical protein F4604DRAFT_1918063 [Suillus subluteus]
MDYRDHLNVLNDGVTPPKDSAMAHELRPNFQPFDWLHSTFECSALDMTHSASDIQKAFDFDNIITTNDRPQSLLDPHSMVNNIHYPRLLSPRVRHAPYIIPRRHRLSLSPVLPPALEALRPPAPAAPPPAPAALPPAPAAPPPAPAVPARAAPSVSLITFGMADLNKVKAAALFQVKCGIFNSSFLPEDDSIIKQMATDCLNAQVCHSVELSAWAKTTPGEEEVTKLCSALVTFRKSMQGLTRSAVLWCYDIHQLLDTEKKVAIKGFIDKLLQNEAFLRGVIKASNFVNRQDVEVPFWIIGMRYHIRQLLCHDRRYKQFIGNNRNIQPLYTFTGVLFKWALSEMSSGTFKDLDFKIADAIEDHKHMVKLFETLTKEQIDALTAGVLD